MLLLKNIVIFLSFSWCIYCHAQLDTNFHLRFTDTTCTSITVQWEDISYEDSYRLRRKLSSQSVFSTIANLGSNVTFYHDTTVSQLNQYDYQVRPLINNLAQGNSRTVSIQAPSCTPNVIDCNGVKGGLARIDGCDICAGGNTGISPTNPSYWFSDADNDGLGDINDSTFGCTPPGYVNNKADLCPSDSNNTCITGSTVTISNLEASTSCNYVEITWSDTYFEEKYRIRRKYIDDSVFTNLTDINAGITTYTDAYIDEGNQYIYQVRPVFNEKAIGTSEFVEVEIPECVFETTGIKESSPATTFYPNPVKGSIHFTQMTSGSILTTQGNLLFTFPPCFHLDIDTLPSGLYFLKTEQSIYPFVKK